MEDNAITDPVLRKQLTAIVDDNIGSNVLTPQQKETVLSKVAVINAQAKTNIEDIQLVRDNAIAAVGEQKTPDMINADRLEMFNFLNSNFAKSHTNFLGLDDSEGGTQLINFVNTKISEGMDVTAIYSALFNIADFEKEFFDNPSVSISKLDKELNRLTDNGNKDLSRASQIATLNQKYIDRRNDINKNTTKQSSAAMNTANIRAGVIDTTRNDNFINGVGTFQRAVTRATAQDNQAISNNPNVNTNSIGSPTNSSLPGVDSVNPQSTTQAGVNTPEVDKGTQTISDGKAGDKLQRALDVLNSNPDVNQGSTNTLFGGQNFSFNYKGERKTAEGKQEYAVFLRQTKEIRKLRDQAKDEAKEAHRKLVRSRLYPNEIN